MGGGMEQWLPQVYGILAVGAFVIAASQVGWLVLEAALGPRVSIEQELEGLDFGEHGNAAHPDVVTAEPSEGWQVRSVPVIKEGLT